MWRKENTVGKKCKLVQPLWKTGWSSLNKLKMQQPSDPPMPLVDIYPKEMKSVSQKDPYTLVFIEVLVTIAKIWKRAVDDYIKKM